MIFFYTIITKGNIYLIGSIDLSFSGICVMHDNLFKDVVLYSRFELVFTLSLVIDPLAFAIA